MSELSLDAKAFILSFMAIVWKRILITTSIYRKHTKNKNTKEIIIKVMKYEIYSDSGIYNNIKPYLGKAIEDGFLMPQFYKQNIYANESVKLFEKSYEIVRENDRAKEISFLKKYSSIQKSIIPFDVFPVKLQGDKCICNFCQLIDSWDINIDLLYSDDYNQNNLMKSLIYAINT